MDAGPHPRFDTVPTRWERYDERFAGVSGDSTVARIATGYRWTEGPVYVPAGRYLLWSDIPDDRLLRWDEVTGTVGVFRSPAGYTNGNTLDGEGRLVSCEHGGRRVTRTEHDGSTTVLAEAFEGRRFNSPNDVVVRSDGSTWFTDPSYGIDSDYEGHAAAAEVDGRHVYRVDVDGGCRRVADDFDRPNGLAFSLDEKQLYVVDTGRNHVRVLDVTDDGGLSGGRVLADCSNGHFDGLRLDSLGRLWVAAGDGVHCLDPDGTLLGKLLLPERVSNLVFGGPKRNLMFVCATTSVYLLMVSTTGAPGVHVGRASARPAHRGRSVGPAAGGAAVRPPCYGIHRGRVVSDLDPSGRGRVQVSVPAVLGDDGLAWAEPCLPCAAGQDDGRAVPPVGTRVWVQFEAGDVGSPVVVGC